ncbi:MAG TPA: hypothetical protein QGF75_02055 [Candidatus Marinimicrobia bacterium]|nr:hypothetical protein [Candidatus Neomarinimicrobiota bacterium]
MSDFTLKKEHLVIKGGTIAGVILPVVGEVKVDTDEYKLGNGGSLTSCDFLEFEGKDPTIDFKIGWISVISICGTALIVLHNMGYDLNNRKSIKEATKNVDGVFDHYQELFEQKPELFGEKWAKEAEKKEKKKKDRETKKKQKIENAAEKEKKVINFLNKKGGVLMYPETGATPSDFMCMVDQLEARTEKILISFESLEAAQEILSPVIKSTKNLSSMQDAYNLLFSLVEKGELIPRKKYEKKLKKEHYPFGKQRLWRFVTKDCYKNMKSGEDAISKEQFEFINAVVELLTEKSIKMTISDIAAHIKSKDRDQVKIRLEKMYEAGVIDFAGSGRYFIYSEKKKKTKSKKTSDKPVDLKAELKKYKALLDEGLIDKDDYEKKKDSLLGL